MTAPHGLDLGRGVIVLGMHRSGTSAVTGMLDALGLPACESADRLPAQSWNERGNFESRGLSYLDERLLNYLGGTWYAPTVPHEGWIHEDAVVAATDEAAQLFGRAHPRGRWVWKDPRACILMPFWDEVLGPDMPRIVVLRHPTACARSLARRNQMAEAHALALTERYLRSAFINSRDRPVFVTTYDELIANPAVWSQQASQFIRGHGVPMPDSPATDQATTFLDPSLRHERPAPRTDDEHGLPPGLGGLWAWATDHIGSHHSLAVEGLPAESVGTEEVLRRAFMDYEPAWPSD